MKTLPSPTRPTDPGWAGIRVGIAVAVAAFPAARWTGIGWLLLPGAVAMLQWSHRGSVPPGREPGSLQPIRN